MWKENLLETRVQNKTNHFAKFDASLSVTYLPEHLLQTLLSDPKILAVLKFEDRTETQSDDPRVVSVGLPQLNDFPLIEVWRSDQPCVSAFRNNVYIAKNSEILFGYLHVDENTHDDDIEDSTFSAYNQILQLITHENYPHLQRMWNYFPKINFEQNHLERYKKFCLGRSRSFQMAKIANSDLPAASAVGTLADGFIIFFLAARTRGIQIENPLQVSAYDYPSEYGPRSPSFARATLQKMKKQSNLYVSGTASIVGHKSVHPNDIAGQFSQTIENINTLLQQAQGYCTSLPADASELSLIKCYVRNPSDYDALLKLATQRLGSQSEIVFLQGDICRQELLLEIEAISYS